MIFVENLLKLRIRVFFNVFKVLYWLVLFLFLGIREVFFVYVILVVGVVYVVIWVCLSGKFIKCGCDWIVKGLSKDGFEWFGCLDNIVYGIVFFKIFVDVWEKKLKKSGKNVGRRLMNLYNNEVGCLVSYLLWRILVFCVFFFF